MEGSTKRGFLFDCSSEDGIVEESLVRSGAVSVDDDQGTVIAADEISKEETPDATRFRHLARLGFILQFAEPIGISRRQLKLGKRIKTRLADANDDIVLLSPAIVEAQVFLHKHVGDFTLAQLIQRYAYDASD